MRVSVLMAVSAILCFGVAAGAQTAASDPAGQTGSGTAAEKQASDKGGAVVGSGGVELLSDTEGVDFGPYLREWSRITQAKWEPLVPDEVKPPTSKSGTVVLRFKILPDGHLMDGGMVLDGRSGDVAMDRAAWKAVADSKFPALPEGFHGPYMELRAKFVYGAQK
ncbi:MAG: energy transducer TonB [Terracidiphilus sp.]|jgi:TonB family protein